MIDALSRALFLTLAGNGLVKQAVSQYGMRGRRSFARRFIAGRGIDEAVDAARGVEDRGLRHTFNHLGEHVRDADAAREATDAYERVIETVRGAGLACNLSIKLTQLGLELDRDLCRDNLDQILRAAERHDAFVRVDMESSIHVDNTLDLVEAMRGRGHTRVGVVLQSALRRTPDDLTRVVDLGLPVRLVKGAYREPADVAFPDRTDVDRAFVQLAERLLAADRQPAFATHDPRMIEQSCRAARHGGIAADRFEFQMLYGVRRDLQAALLSHGYAVRIYLPFGDDWFAYFMRRLAERPANVLFVARSLLYEQIGDHRTFGPGQ